MKQIGLKYIFICELLYVLTTAVAKLSIGVYFLRLSNKEYQARVIYTTLSVVMLFSTMYFFFLVFQCTPIEYIWTQFGTGKGSCLSRSVLANVTYAHAAMSAVTDWSFGILPVFFVWKMKMNPRTKLSVILILSLGFLYVFRWENTVDECWANRNSASSATIVRIVYIRQLEHTTDYSWHGINLVKWSMVEPAIGITAAAIATLRPLFANFLSFASKNLHTNESLTSFADATRTNSSPGESTKSRMGTNINYCSDEFAEMLGLKRYGVTTHISAQKPPGWRERRRRAKKEAMVLGDCESQTQLRGCKEEGEWVLGIKATTTINIEAEQR